MHHIIFFLTLFLVPACIYSQNTAALSTRSDTISGISILEQRPSRTSVGISLGGGGLLGIPVRIQAGKNFFLEAGIHHRPVIAFSKDPFSIYAIEQSLMFSGGFNILKPLQWKESKSVYRNQGFACHFGRSIPYATTFASIGMIWERFRPKKSNRSFIFEAGLVGYKDEFHDDPPFNGSEEDNRWRASLYWKVHWNYFLKKK